MSATALASLILAYAIAVSAADGPLAVRSSSLPSDTRFRSGTDLVLINAAAYDRQGRLVTDLRPQQLRLFDEGVERQISAFALEDVPVSLAIVVDASSSMKRALPHVRAALSQLSSAAKPEDEFLLITVRDEPVVSVPFTMNVAAVEDVIGVQAPSGDTAVIDALVLAFHKVKDGRNARKAILLFSDGRDTNSRYGWSELRRLGRESNAPVYAFVVPGMNEDDVMDALRLQHIAEDTGGRCVMVGRSREFPEKMRSLDIHRQYVVGFSPPAGGEGSSSYRRIGLKLKSSGRNVKLYWRRGYFR